MSGFDRHVARRLIRELSPLRAGDVELAGQGTDSAAFRVDGEWVVRFPLVSGAQRALGTELALLPALAKELPVAVPCPEHVAERDGQLVFSAYRALEGEPLSDAALCALAPTARARALDELAALLDAIHRFAVDSALAIIGAFCGPRTLAGVLAHMDPADAQRARAGLPFLLTIRWLQDVIYIGGDHEDAEPALRRLHAHLLTAR